MAAPTFKFSLLLEWGDRGWSEEWWTNKTNYSDLESAAEKLARLRYQETVAGVSVIGARLVNTALPRTGYVVTYPAFAAKSAGSPSGNVSEAWLLRLRDSASGAKRNYYMRAMNNPIVETPVVAGNFQPSAGVIQAKQNLIKYLAANGVGIRTAGRIHQFPAKEAQIDSIANGANDQLSLTGTGLGALKVNDTDPFIVSGFKGICAKLNGTYGAHQWKSSGANTVLISVGVSAAQVTAYPGLGAFGRTPTYDFAIPDQGSLEFLSDKNTGRAFFVPRGRRSGKR